MKSASIAELRQAVEAFFNDMPQKGTGKISWYVHCIFFLTCVLSGFLEKVLFLEHREKGEKKS